MKKYIQPHTTLTVVRPQQLLAESPLPATPDTPGIGSARYRNPLWDDDDDDWLLDE